MDYEWDSVKSAQNLRQRGFGFDYATYVFDGATIETPTTGAPTAKSGSEPSAKSTQTSWSSSTRTATKAVGSFPLAKPTGKSASYGNRSQIPSRSAV